MGKFESKNRVRRVADEQSPEIEARYDPSQLWEAEDWAGAQRLRPAPIRAQGAYSVEALRQVHEGRAYYDQSSAPVPAVASDWEEDPDSDWDGETQPEPERRAARPGRRKKKKKHRLLRFSLKLACLLLALFVLGAAVSALLAQMPESEQSIGPRRSGCATVLLCGTDEDGTRTDTMILLYLEQSKGISRLLSLPRDTMVNRDNPVPKLNGAYGANGAGEKGMGFLMDYVKDLVGFRPDGYILVDLNCFADLVDTMGGVSFDVPMDMAYEDPSQDLFIDLKQGDQTLNGQEAMWLVRFRSGYAMADLERIRVQRDFMQSAVSQWKSVTKLPRLPFAASLLIRNSQSDLSYRNLCWVALALARSSGDMENDTLPGTPEWVNGGAYYVEDRVGAAALVNEKYNPYEREITANDLHPYGY